MVEMRQFHSLWHATAPIEERPGHTFVPVRQGGRHIEMATDHVEPWWWTVSDRVVDTSYYPSLAAPSAEIVTLMTYCVFVEDDEGYIYYTLEMLGTDVRIIRGARTWKKAEWMHWEEHQRLMRQFEGSVFSAKNLERKAPTQDWE